jgi:asparagine synthase (glutamine-hydrolysing)
MIERSIAEHGYRVSLSGTAADELFSGYYDHHLAYLAVLHGAPEHTAARVAWERTVKPNVRNPHLGDPDLFVRDSGFRDHIFLHADRFSSWLVEPWNEPFAETHYAEDLLRNRMLNELRHESVPVILHEDDLNAMAFSIENRSPYLDAALCDFCFSIPSRHLVRNGVAKAILRDAVRGIVPDLVLDNPRKVGFNLSILSCLDGRDPAVRAELLGDSPILDVVRRERIADLLDRDELPNSESKFLFIVINAKFFLEEFGR